MRVLIFALTFIFAFMTMPRAFAAAPPAEAPIPIPAPPPEPQAEPQPAPEPDLDHMLGSMLMLGFRGASLPQNSPFLQMIREGKIGNVILFDKDVATGAQRNVVSPDQLGKLCAAIKAAAATPIFIAIDQEGGQVRRLKAQKGFFNLPSAQSMGQGNPHTTLELASEAGREMARLGINLDFAPCVDVDTNPFNPIIGRLGRAFSSDAQIVARHALAFGLGLAKTGVAPVLKHFPGMGCAKEDPHTGSADVSQCWKPDIDLLPYAEIFRQGWPGAVMTAHIVQSNLDPSLAATFSKKIITGLLREGLGWEGVVISDDLQMKGAAEGKDLQELMLSAIDAGIDILLFGNNLQYDPDLPAKVWQQLRLLVDEGKVSEERIRESWRRISALHAAFAK